MRRVAVGVVLAGCVALAGCAPEAAEDPRVKPPLVATATVAASDEVAQSFVGVVRARVESDLGFRVNGKVIERMVEVGQTVRRDQPLMRLDLTDLALAATAQSANVLAARAKALQANAELQRQQGLLQRGVNSKQVYDLTKANADSANANLEAAEAQASVARNAQGYAVLLADADGVVLETGAEPGQVVAAGQTVVKIARAGAREAQVGLPERLRPALGTRAQARLYGKAEQTFSARLRQLSQSADPATRTFDARFVLEDVGAAAPLGATVTVSLRNEARAPTAEVPLGALYDFGGGLGVWIVEADRVRFKPVKLKRLREESAEVEDLASGTRIVGLGADRLREGQTVRVAPMVGMVEAAALP